MSTPSAAKKVLAIAGIGHPQRFFNLLHQLGITATTKALADHEAISEAQFSQWQQVYDIILMTEKDAVKCSDFTAGLCFYLPVQAHIASAHGEQLLEKLASLRQGEVES